MLLDISKLAKDLPPPQCTWERDEACFDDATWSIEGCFYCDYHKEILEAEWAALEAELKEPPEGADGEDLELLELIRHELEQAVRSHAHGHIGPGVYQTVIRELNLPSDSVGWNLTSWYLWKMEIISINARWYICTTKGS